MAIDVTSLSAEELDQLIAQAIERRAQMEPQVPAERPTEAVLAVGSPAWQIEPIAEGMLVQLRHPGAGWLNFIFPHAVRAHMLTAMLHQALLNPQKSGPDLPGATSVPGGAGSGHLH
jgi:hypothetical protein